MFHVRCEFICAETVKFPDHAAATHLFRIAQEAVSNAIKHGHAKKISIRLAAGAEQLQLSVQDNGSGFPEKKSHGQGMGLRIMQSRIGMVGGTLRIENLRGGGVTVSWSSFAALLARRYSCSTCASSSGCRRAVAISST